MVAISRWLKLALAQTPGCTRVVARDEFYQVIREFYSESLAWREVVDRDVVANTSAYTITPDTSGASTHRVLAVELNQLPLRAVTRRPVGNYALPGTPRFWWLTNLTTVNLWRTPSTSQSGALSVYIGLVPTADSSMLPDIAQTEHFDALMDGLLGRLHQHPGKPYSDLVRAEYHLKRFRRFIATFSGQGKVGNIPGAQAWSFPSFGK